MGSQNAGEREKNGNFTGWFVWMLGVKITEQTCCSRLGLRPVMCVECPDPSGEPYEGKEGEQS